jgi:hypothetical protein
MRAILDHIINPVNDKLSITVMDDAGPGGANHHYVIHNASIEATDIKFQKGGIKDNGINGITQEALLAIVIDRLRCFDKGPFSSRENALALTKCEEALQWLHSRTIERMRRGVEGKEVA